MNRKEARARRDALAVSDKICSKVAGSLEPDEVSRFGIFLDLPGRNAGIGGVTDWIGNRSAMREGAARADAAGFAAAESMAVILTDRRLVFLESKWGKVGAFLGAVPLASVAGIDAKDGFQTGTALTGQTTRFGMVGFAMRNGSTVVLQSLHLAAPELFLAATRGETPT